MQVVACTGEPGTHRSRGESAGSGPVPGPCQP